MILDARNEVTKPEGRSVLIPSNVVALLVHHSVSDPNGPQAPDEQATEAQERAHIRAIDTYHVSQDYGSFAYHLAAFPSGRVYHTMNLNGMGSHVWGRNHQAVAVVAIGNYVLNQPNQGVIDAVVEALKFMRLTYPNREILGHGQFTLPGHGSECPGVLANIGWEGLLSEEDVKDNYPGEIDEHRAQVVVIEALMTGKIRAGFDENGALTLDTGVVGNRWWPSITVPDWGKPGSAG